MKIELSLPCHATLDYAFGLLTWCDTGGKRPHLPIKLNSDLRWINSILIDGLHIDDSIQPGQGSLGRSTAQATSQPTTQNVQISEEYGLRRDVAVVHLIRSSRLDPRIFVYYQR
jgi:hypothetical protein